MKKLLSFIFVLCFMLPFVSIAPKADTSDFTEQVLYYTNIEREKYGLQPLKADSVLQSAAQGRAVEITTTFSHTRPNGQDCFSIIDWKSEGFRAVAENIACGQQTPQEVVNGWMNSAGHRANILNANYTHLGVGYVYKSSDTYGHYWSQFFGQSTSANRGGNSYPAITTTKPVVTTIAQVTKPVVTTKAQVTKPTVTTKAQVTYPVVTTEKTVTVKETVTTKSTVFSQENILNSLLEKYLPSIKNYTPNMVTSDCENGNCDTQNCETGNCNTSEVINSIFGQYMPKNNTNCSTGNSYNSNSNCNNGVNNAVNSLLENYLAVNNSNCNTVSIPSFQNTNLADSISGLKSLLGNIR
ncbi:MAG: CAP domain-containing protein [Oscillospiraceae bacterium]|jgi:uncharacterized protein YkwD|nr:CAP domain-containing protein [Oscillospiraceae bacterium]